MDKKIILLVLSNIGDIRLVNQYFNNSDITIIENIENSKKEPDLILTDVVQFERYKDKLLEIKKKSKYYLPIVIVLKERIMFEPYIKAGIDDVLRIPISRVDFGVRLNLLLWIRQQSREIIEHTEQKYKAIFESTGTATLIVDEDTTILMANKECYNLLGYSVEELVGQSWTKYVVEEYLDEMIKNHNMRRINPEVVPKRYEVELYHKNGNKINVQLYVGMMPNKKQTIVSMFDITQRKQYEKIILDKNKEIEAQNVEYKRINEELLVAKEKAEESDRLKTAFLQNMSHEIRTPMNAIMGFSELISLQYNNKEKVEKYSKIINQRCNDLLCLIDDILDIARIESGQLSINPQSTNLSKLCNEIYQLFKEHQKKINKENIQLKKEPNFKYKNIIIDDVKLKQIFINLVNNAFKFTKEGVVTFGCKNYSDNEILFYVSDTGIGIPKDKFDYIFERFTQLEVGLSKQYGGTGLGLSIVKGLVKLLGGKIWLESELGKGTTFYFTIPFSIDEEEKAKTEKSEDKPIQFNQCLNYTILIVEDDYYNSVYLKELLEDYGFKTISTEYGEEAIKIINNQEVDMILMDIRLPDIDGYETTRRIRKQYPKLKIIAQTAYAMPEDRNKALEAGCNDFVTKPIDPGQLFEKIKTSLEI